MSPSHFCHRSEHYRCKCGTFQREYNLSSSILENGQDIETQQVIDGIHIILPGGYTIIIHQNRRQASFSRPDRGTARQMVIRDDPVFCNRRSNGEHKIPSQRQMALRQQQLEQELEALEATEMQNYTGSRTSRPYVGGVHSHHANDRNIIPDQELEPDATRRVTFAAEQISEIPEHCQKGSRSHTRNKSSRLTGQLHEDTTSTPSQKYYTKDVRTPVSTSAPKKWLPRTITRRYQYCRDMPTLLQCVAQSRGRGDLSTVEYPHCLERSSKLGVRFETRAPDDYI